MKHWVIWYLYFFSWFRPRESLSKGGSLPDTSWNDKVGGTKDLGREPFSDLGLFKVIFYFPNGKSTMTGHPLSKSKQKFMAETSKCTGMPRPKLLNRRDFSREPTEPTTRVTRGQTETQRAMKLLENLCSLCQILAGKSHLRFFRFKPPKVELLDIKLSFLPTKKHISAIVWRSCFCPIRHGASVDGHLPRPRVDLFQASNMMNGFGGDEPSWWVGEAIEAISRHST